MKKYFFYLFIFMGAFLIGILIGEKRENAHWVQQQITVRLDQNKEVIGVYSDSQTAFDSNPAFVNNQEYRGTFGRCYKRYNDVMKSDVWRIWDSSKSPKKENENILKRAWKRIKLFDQIDPSFPRNRRGAAFWKTQDGLDIKHSGDKL